MQSREEVKWVLGFARFLLEIFGFMALGQTNTIVVNGVLKKWKLV